MSGSIVIGAAGFIGRAIVAHLLRQDHRVVAAVRPGTDRRLTTWLDAHDIDRRGLTVVSCDVTAPDLGLPERLDHSDIRDVYNCAARFAFGLEHQDAYAVNVTGALHALEWAGRLRDLRRVVHISGYRVTADSAAEKHSDSGAYESTKVESDQLLRQRAEAKNIPLTIANPSSVVGTGQYIGLAKVIEDLWRGKLPAIPGGNDTFVPVVDLDYFVGFLIALPKLPDTAGHSYTVLDQRTPMLPSLIRLVADHLGVRAPRAMIPAGVLARLPRAVTGADPETLTFLTEDRYDTTAAEDIARRAGLTMPPVEDVLRRWVEHLVASRFGAVDADPSAGFLDGAWVGGDRRTPKYVLAHGLPLDSEEWAGVRGSLDGTSMVIDLPGLGRSAPDSIDDGLARALRSVETRPVLVGHSLGCAPVLRYAAAHPDRVSGIVLVAPAFLQERTRIPLRSPLTTIALRRVSARRLAQLLAVPESEGVASAAANLRRPGVAARAVGAHRTAGAASTRRELRELLDRVATPVHLVVGADDPLTVASAHPTTVIESAGHFAPLTHPDQIAAALTENTKSRSRA
ncbi:alpha/beta fold hydrolase [Nocardia callitridis]|uniref:Alpha/beta fold hydrolase n=1 Tax=Nocardia callitridis TaxID=648753 RepID=A0ABP9KNM6_9NOCA